MGILENMNMAREAMGHLSQICQTLWNIEDALQETPDEYGRRTFSGTCDASGNFQYTFNGNPGESIELISFSAIVGPIGNAQTGYIAFFTDEVRGTQLHKVLSLTSMVSDPFAERAYIPSGSAVIVVIAGAVANSNVEGNVVFRRNVQPEQTAVPARNAGRDFADVYTPGGDVVTDDIDHAPNNLGQARGHSASSRPAGTLADIMGG